MKIAILGAAGMLGQALAAEFADEDPLCWDRADLDITDQARLQAALGDAHIDTIINAAAYTAVDKAETEREAAFAVNETGVANLAVVAKKSGATLVHYSTDYVFPGTNPSGYAEDDTPGPAVNVYGQSKLAGERQLRSIAPRYFLIRTAWLYGAGGKNFVDIMLELAKTKKELSIINDQHGSPTYTVDVARATRTLLTGNYPPGTYHAVSTGHTTWYEFSQKIFALAHKKVHVTPIPSDQYPLPAKRPRYSMLKNTKGPALPPWEVALDNYINKNYHS